MNFSEPNQDGCYGALFGDCPKYGIALDAIPVKPQREQSRCIAGQRGKCTLFPNGCVAVRDDSLSFETINHLKKYEKIDI